MRSLPHASQSMYLYGHTFALVGQGCVPNAKLEMFILLEAHVKLRCFEFITNEKVKKLKITSTVVSFERVCHGLCA